MKTEEIGSELRRARAEAGMTQQALARAAKVPQPTIARIERGTVTPRAATLITLLHATGHELAVRPIQQRVRRDALGAAIRETSGAMVGRPGQMSPEEVARSIDEAEESD